MTITQVHPQPDGAAKIFSHPNLKKMSFKNLYAKKTREPKKNAFNPKHRKTKWAKTTYVVIGSMPDGFWNSQVLEVVEVQIFWKPSAQTVFACVWVRHDPAGSGDAGGSGYHKESHATAAAFANAGYDFFCDLDKNPTFLGGYGDRAVKEMCLAVASLIRPDLKLSFHQF